MVEPEDYSHRIYEQTLVMLESRKTAPGFDRKVIEAEFEALCVYQGHGMTGRNAVKDAEIEGQIDAYQVFLHRLV